MDWVGSEVLPHEADLRRWLRRSIGPDELEDVIQEAYCRISGLGDVDHIVSGRAYLFTAARNIALERIRRSRIVSIETVTEIDALSIHVDQASPEQIASGRNELARVKRLIAQLPDRCRQVFELRKIEGLSQRAVAETLGVSEETVENDVRRGLKLVLKAIAESDTHAELNFKEVDHDGRTRNSASDR
jgi:RNA polymerase sigma factor (sigma-70 family)